MSEHLPKTFVDLRSLPLGIIRRALARTARNQFEPHLLE